MSYEIGRSAMIRKRKSALDVKFIMRPPKTAQFQNAFSSANSPCKRRNKFFIGPECYE